MEQQIVEEGEDYFQPSQYDETREPNYYDEDIRHQNEGWDASELSLDQNIERLRYAGERVQGYKYRDLLIAQLRRSAEKDEAGNILPEAEQRIATKEKELSDLVVRHYPDERFVHPRDWDYRRQARKMKEADEAKAKQRETDYMLEKESAAQAVYDYRQKHPRHQ
jgi:hypothetical protein